MSSTKRIHEHSSNAHHSGTELFGVPLTNVSINRSQYREILPLNSADESPYEFRSFSDNTWFDLSKTYLYLRARIEKKQADGTWAPLTQGDGEIAPVQQFGQSFVQQLKMFVNGTEVYDSGTHYPYISYIKNELNYSNDVKSTWLAASGYAVESSMDTLSTGFQERRNNVKNGEICEYVSRLDFDLANQSRYLLNNLDVIFTIYKKNDRFLIHAPDATAMDEFRVKVYAVKLYVKIVDVQPTMNLGVMAMLEKHSAKYPLRRTEMRTNQVAKGRTECTYNVFTNIIPRRLVVGMVDNSAYTGHFKKNPFKFEHFNVKTVSVNAGGVIYPSVSYQMHWEGDPILFMRPYIELMDSTMTAPNTSNGITPYKFKDGWTFFVIPLTSTLDDDEGFELIKNGTTTVHIEFNQPLAEPVELVVLGEFDQLLTIDRNRVVVGDGAV